MTRRNEKETEIRTLNALLAALGLHPDEAPKPGETPDFTLLASGRTIGVEVTMYQSGTTVNGGMGLRQVESEWDRLKLAVGTTRPFLPRALQRGPGHWLLHRFADHSPSSR